MTHSPTRLQKPAATGGIFFTSDTHFGHPLVARIRGFKTPEEHDAAVAENWRKRIRPRDTVYLLGDISSGRVEAIEHALEVIADLPGTKHLIAGNHDPVASAHRGGWRHQRRFLEVFESVRDFARIRITKKDVLLSHYPYFGYED